MRFLLQKLVNLVGRLAFMAGYMLEAPAPWFRPNTR